MAYSLVLVAHMANDVRTSLPTGCHAKLSSPVNTMEHLKRGVKIGEKVAFDLESIFICLLLIGQQREMELLPVFGYDLRAVPPSFVDECSRNRRRILLRNARVHMPISFFIPPRSHGDSPVHFT